MTRERGKEREREGGGVGGEGMGGDRPPKNGWHLAVQRGNTFFGVREKV